MFSGVRSTLQKNAEVHDLFTTPSCLYFMVISLCGKQDWVKEYNLNDLMWINMTDVTTGVICQQFWSTYLGEIGGDSLMDKVHYVFLQSIATLTATSIWMDKCVPLDDLPELTPLLAGVVGYGCIESVAHESLRQYALYDLKNKEREEQGFSLAENYMRQAEYMYSGAEKTQKLQQTLDIFRSRGRSSFWLYGYGPKKLNYLLRKEEFDYI